MTRLSSISRIALALFLVGCAAETTTNKPVSQEEAEAELPPQEKTTAPASPTSPTSPSPSPAQGTVEGETFALPAWMRVDVQPKSTRYQQTYGLEAFRGKTVVVVLLEGHCPYCQSNSTLAQQLNDELAAEGYDAQVLVLADAYGEQFTDKVAVPIFNDPDKSAWKTMRPNASKHDTYVFAPNGERTWFKAGTYQGEPASWKTETGAAVRAVAQKK